MFNQAKVTKAFKIEDYTIFHVNNSLCHSIYSVILWTNYDSFCYGAALVKMFESGQSG